MRTLYRLLAAAVLNRPPREFAFFAQQTPEWRDLAMKFILNTNLSRKDPLEDTSNALKRAEGTVVDGSAIFDCLLTCRMCLSWLACSWCVGMLSPEAKSCGVWYTHQGREEEAHGCPIHC
jgi:hypothetical protein